MKKPTPRKKPAPRKKAAPPRTVSQRQYAAMRGVAPSTIAQAVAEGRIRLANGGVVVSDADATWYQRHLRRNDGLRSGAESEAKRDRAVLTRTVANVQMTRRKAERLGQRLIERDRRQTTIGAIAGDTRGLIESPTDRRHVDAFAREYVAMVLADLGDLNAEALKVLQDGTKP